MLQPTDRPPASRAPRLARFHHARAAAGHHREAEADERAADLARQRVVAVVLVETRRAEHRDARSNEMQRAKAADEVAARAQQQQQFLGARMRAFEAGTRSGSDIEMELSGGF